MNRTQRSLGTLAWGLALLLSSCQDDAQFRALNDQIRALESSQAQSKAEMSRLQMQMRSLQTERDKIKEERDKLESQVKEAANALDSVKKDFENYKQQYKVSIRKRAPGMLLEMVEVEGKRFENVKIRELTDSSLVFMHQAGTMSVQLSELKPDMQARLGYQPASTQAIMASRKAGEAKGVDLDDEFKQVDQRLAEVKREMAGLQRQLMDVSTAVIRETNKIDGDPTVHRSAEAAIRVRLNELEITHKTLNQRSQELAQQIRLSRSR